VHALDESLEDHTPLKQEPKEEIHEESHQPFEEEQEHVEDLDNTFNLLKNKTLMHSFPSL
jgi:hypothetical protein